jgi:hypothetical protein
LAIGQLLIGALSVVADHGHTGARWGQACKSFLVFRVYHLERKLIHPIALMIVWLFTYDMTVGPVAYAIVGEVSSTRLRNKTISLSRLSYNVFSVAFGVMMPYMLVSYHFVTFEEVLRTCVDPAEPYCLELERQDRICLGSDLLPVLHLGILQIARDEGEYRSQESSQRARIQDESRLTESGPIILRD